MLLVQLDFIGMTYYNGNLYQTFHLSFVSKKIIKVSVYTVNVQYHSG